MAAGPGSRGKLASAVGLPLALVNIVIAVATARQSAREARRLRRDDGAALQRRLAKAADELAEALRVQWREP